MKEYECYCFILNIKEYDRKCKKTRAVTGDSAKLDSSYTGCSKEDKTMKEKSIMIEIYF
jgi:hypothetical protein